MNPHGFLHTILSRARMPIPPLGLLEARAGIEPAYNGFADRCVTTSPPRHHNFKSSSMRLSIFAPVSISNETAGRNFHLSFGLMKSRNFLSFFFKSPIISFSFSSGKTLTNILARRRSGEISARAAVSSALDLISNFIKEPARFLSREPAFSCRVFIKFNLPYFLYNFNGAVFV